MSDFTMWDRINAARGKTTFKDINNGYIEFYRWEDKKIKYGMQVIYEFMKLCESDSEVIAAYLVGDYGDNKYIGNSWYYENVFLPENAEKISSGQIATQEEIDYHTTNMHRQRDEKSHKDGDIVGLVANGANKSMLQKKLTSVNVPNPDNVPFYGIDLREPAIFTEDEFNEKLNNELEILNTLPMLRGKGCTIDNLDVLGDPVLEIIYNPDAADKSLGYVPDRVLPSYLVDLLYRLPNKSSVRGVELLRKPDTNAELQRSMDEFRKIVKKPMKFDDYLNGPAKEWKHIFRPQSNLNDFNEK